MATGLSRYRTVTAPADLTVIQAVIDRLAGGLAGAHTESGLNEEISFVVADGQTTIELIFPDYAGEQVRSLVSDRLISSRWQELITQSDEWLLLIRPDMIPTLEDITTRGLAYVEDLQVRLGKVQQEAELTAPGFFIELLQMMLYVKGKSALAPISEPRLTVALSCWDTLGLATSGVVPAVELKQRLPFLAAFLETIWAPDNWRVCGLSSLGRSLDATNPDEDFVDDGPEAAGYVVLPSGEHDPDLTQLIAF
ncbi:hypothetical protein [Hymenobacter sp. BRD67]|uniref:TRAFAC clade GTPase domain-containing protein n=1 Tax=Hymenobacter sp. BRD67 TaxID=2675877 RepID=UPI0015641296|nr:hypothetical protein [Hymenobacter sp. BRD67]QKG51827.1 hypothetical protein GKZ67_03425 [Hymenobacter sp. BRD67]